MRAALAIGALACALTACAPAVVWHGHTPDRTARVQVLEHRGYQYVTVDSSAGSRFDGVAISSLVMSPDGRRFAYAARRGRSWSVVVDEDVGPAWSGIGEIVFSDDGRHVSYSAQRGRDWFVVHDTSAGPPFDAILSGSITVSPAGRMAYAGQRGDSVYVVIDGQAGVAWDGVASLRFDPAGERVAYVGRRGHAVFIVVDGGLQSAYEAVADFGWLGDGRIGALVRRERAWFAHIGTARHGPFAAVGALQLAPDSWAFLARTAEGDRIIEPAGAGPVFDAILPGSLKLHAATGRTAYIAYTPEGMIVVAAGRAGSPATHISDLTFAADGERFGYIARSDGRDHVVVDHTVHASADAITDLAFDPCGRPAWVTHGSRSSAVNFAGETYTYDLVVERTFVVSAEAPDWAAVVATSAARRLDIVVNGVPTGRRFDWNELAAALIGQPEQLVAEHAARIIRTWMLAELRLQLPGTQATGSAARC